MTTTPTTISIRSRKRPRDIFTRESAQVSGESATLLLPTVLARQRVMLAPALVLPLVGEECCRPLRPMQLLQTQQKIMRSTPPQVLRRAPTSGLRRWPSLTEEECLQRRPRRGVRESGPGYIHRRGLQQR